GGNILSAGLDNVVLVLTLTPRHTIALRELTADNCSADLTLSVTAHAKDSTAATADSATQTIALTINPVSEAPILGAGDATAATRSEERRVGKACSITPTFEIEADAVDTIKIRGVLSGTIQ